VFKHLAGAASLVLVAAAGVSAQPARADDEQMKARYNIFVMEGVLERAVDYGADVLRKQVRSVMPDMILISGAAQARGFWLDGYGVFFDVEVPALRQSVVWSMRTMIDGNGAAATTALQDFKRHVETIQDPALKANLLSAVKRLELQIGPVRPPVAAAPRGTATAAVVDPMVAAAGAPAPPPAPRAEDAALLDDPNEAYTESVKDALIDAMLDNSGAMRVGPDEWLIVAARDNLHRDRLMPGDVYDTSTIMLRVKGSDLAAYRAERITKEEARRRVEVREF
jgi:hypothetical protein